MPWYRVTAVAVKKYCYYHIPEIFLRLNQGLGLNIGISEINFAEKARAMHGESLLFWVIQLLILALGLSIGRSVLILKMRREENKRRELELALLEKRASVLQEGKQIAHDLEEVLYQAKVQQEIENIIKKNKSR
jgi:hypothetical protein